MPDKFSVWGSAGIAPLLLVIAAVGIISFLLISSIGPFTGIFRNLFPIDSSSAAEIIPPTCTDSLQTRINNAAAGSTITLTQNCVYREEITINKSLTLDGANKAQIRGSDLWTSWTQTGSTWTSNQTVPLNNNNYNNPDGRCGKDECYYPHQVFIDGVKQRLVLGRVPVAGEFSVDQNFKTGPLNPAKIILGTNPSGKTVEVTTRYAWVYGNLQATDNVTLKNFTMKHAGTNAGKGSLDIHRCNQCAATGQITIEGNDLSYSHGMNVGTYANTKFIGNDSHHADNFGIGTGDNITDDRSNMLIQNNKIHDNALDKIYNCGWGCGGLKYGKVKNSVIDNNDTYNNWGPGLWCDVQCFNITFSRNRIHHNLEGPGIFFEVSDGAKIFDNVVWKNITLNNGWGYDTGILISSSKNTEIFNNIVAWNDNDQITIISQTRTDHAAAGYSNLALNHYVHDNYIFGMDSTITPFSAPKAPGAGLGWMAETTSMFDQTNNNRGANNKYFYENAESTSLINGRFYWNGGHKLLANFNATPGEEAGRYLTVIEKNQILKANNLPLCPTCSDPTPQPSSSPTPTTTPSPATPTPGSLPGDISGPNGVKDGRVWTEDYNIIITQFGQTGALTGDISGLTGIPDGRVWTEDYNIIITNFGRQI